MQPHVPLNQGELSVASVFAALQDKLPPEHEKCIGYSELDFFNLQALKSSLDQGDWVITGYTNYWHSKLERVSPFLVDWTFGFLAAGLALIMIGGVLGLLGSGSAIEAIFLFGMSALFGLVLPIRYLSDWSPMACRSVTVINGKTKELIHACCLSDDEPVDQLRRISLSELTVEIKWGEIADHAPSFLAVYARASRSAGEQTMGWPYLLVATVDHTYLTPLPDDLTRRAEDFAGVLGARYAGLAPE